MAGLINKARGPAAPEAEDLAEHEALPQDAAEDAAEGEAPDVEDEDAGLTPDAVQGKMQIPAKLRAAYDRVVLAGKKIMFSEQMAPEIQAALQGPGSTGEKIGNGVIGLLAILIDKSNGTMPPQIIIPVATTLTAEAGKFLKDAGVPVTSADIADGMGVVVETLLSKSGVSLDQVPQMLQGGGRPPQPTPAPAPMGA